MKRLAVALVAAVAASIAPSAAAADTCPNAVYRKGPGANLPDCRAWEQATPVNKEGNEPNPELGAYPSPDGNRVMSQSPGNIGGAQGTPYEGSFASARGSAWNTIGVDAPLDSRPTPFFDTIFLPTVGYSADRSKALVVSLQKRAPQAVQGDSNLYVRDTADGSYTWAATAPGSALYSDLTSSPAGAFKFYAANPDFTRFAFTSVLSLVPGALDDGASANLYVVEDGRFTLASRDTAGDAVPTARQFSASSAPRLVSDDGRRITFIRDTFPGRAVFQGVDGSSSVLISRSHRAGDDQTAPVDPQFDGYGVWPSADGTTVTFATTYNSTLTDSGPPSPFYRWSANGDQLENLLAGVTLPWSATLVTFTLLHVSPDGRYLWFSVVYPDANGGYVSQLDVLDTQEKRIATHASVSASDAIFNGTAARFSPDGTKMVGTTGLPLTNYDHNEPNGACASVGCSEAFTFDAQRPGSPPVCVSCGAAGSHSVGNAGIGISGLSSQGRPANTVITNAGRVFFDTPQRLAAADANDLADVYEYTPGQTPALVSSGTGSTPATLAGTSSSGDDVFFFSADPLVPQDYDAANDVYDARVNGGLAAQQVPFRSGSSCPSGDCPGQDTPVPVPDAPGTSALRALPKPPVFSVGRVSSAARRAAASTGRLRVSVRIGAAGRLSARASARVERRSSTAGRATVRARRAGRFTLTLGLSRAARRALVRKGKLAVTLSVSYSRASKPATQSFTLTAPRTRSSARGGAR